jgi:hypothetical protein
LTSAHRHPFFAWFPLAIEVGVAESDVRREGDTNELPNSTDFFVDDGTAVERLDVAGALALLVEQAVGGCTHTRGGDDLATGVRRMDDWGCTSVSAELSQSPDWVPSVVVPREPKLPLLKLSRICCREARARWLEKGTSPVDTMCGRPLAADEDKPMADECVRGTL